MVNSAKAITPKRQEEKEPATDRSWTKTEEARRTGREEERKKKKKF